MRVLMPGELGQNRFVYGTDKTIAADGGISDIESQVEKIFKDLRNGEYNVGLGRNKLVALGEPAVPFLINKLRSELERSNTGIDSNAAMRALCKTGEKSSIDFLLYECLDSRNKDLHFNVVIALSEEVERITEGMIYTLGAVAQNDSNSNTLRRAANSTLQSIAVRLLQGSSK